MNDINPGIARWIEKEVVLRYDLFDKGHQRDHARYVIGTALEFSQYYDIDVDTVAVAEACHDWGLSVDRKTHLFESGRIIREMKGLEKWFTLEQVETIVQAAEDHRVSSDREPRTIIRNRKAPREIFEDVYDRETVWQANH